MTFATTSKQGFEKFFFIFLLYTFLNPLKEEIVESDSLKDKIIKIFNVREDLKDAWSTNLNKWFVTSSEVEEIRRPGLLKLEFLSTSGHMVCLAPKSYLVENSAGERKQATKGIPTKLKISLEVIFN